MRLLRRVCLREPLPAVEEAGEVPAAEGVAAAEAAVAVGVEVALLEARLRLSHLARLLLSLLDPLLVSLTLQGPALWACRPTRR